VPRPRRGDLAACDGSATRLQAGRAERARASLRHSGLGRGPRRTTRGAAPREPTGAPDALLHAPGLWDIAMLLTSTGAVGDGGRDVVRADRGCGRSLPRCCSCRLERCEITPGTLPTSSGALPGTCWPLPGRIWTLLDAGAGVGDGTRHVADVFCRVAGHLLAVTRS